jgi:Arc/MetJ-type ribon-helix-helix transcriptional regulator
MPERKKKEERRMKISGTIKPAQFKWMKEKIEEGTFYNKSHALQQALELLQKQEKHQEK